MDEAIGDTPAAPRLPGQVLAQERERQGLSRQEVAARIHMSPWQVEALEGGDYARLPKGTFLRGFVRNYAKALGLQPDALLPMLAEAAGEGAPRIVVPSQNIRFDPMGDRLSNPYVKAAGLAVVVVSLGFAAMYWWLFIRPTPPAAARKPEPAPPVATAPATPALPSPQQIATAPVVPAEAPAPRDAPLVEEPPAPSPAPPDRAATPAAAAASPARGEARVHLRFKGESWVEIRDASGRVLLSQLNPPRTEAGVTGKPPLAVVVGNAPNVEVTYNDRAINLEPHTKVAVARFTLQ